MSLHSYHSRQTPGMSVSVDVGENRIRCKFVNHLYQTEDDEIAAALDKVLAKPGAATMAVGKIDKTAAEKQLIEAMRLEAAKHKGVLGAGGTGILDNPEVQKPSINNPTQNFSETGVGNTLEQVALQQGQAIPAPLAPPAPPAEVIATPEMPNEIALQAPASQPGAGVLPTGSVPAEVPAAAPSLSIAPIAPAPQI